MRRHRGTGAHCERISASSMRSTTKRTADQANGTSKQKRKNPESLCCNQKYWKIRGTGGGHLHDARLAVLADDAAGGGGGDFPDELHEERHGEGIPRVLGELGQIGLHA
jgi:hypothetical protein